MTRMGKSGYSLILVLIVLVVGGAFVSVALFVVESRNRLGFQVMAQKDRYNESISSIERGKGWIHDYIVTTGDLPAGRNYGSVKKLSDLVVHSTDHYVIYDLRYSLASSSMDASFVGIPQWQLSTYDGSISLGGGYPSSNGGVGGGTGEDPTGIGIYLIQSITEEGRKVHEVIVAEGK